MSDKISCSVNTFIFDDHCLRNSLKPSSLKIAVAGAELPVINSALSILKMFQSFLLIEISRKWSQAFGYRPNEIIDILSPLYHRAVCL